MFRINLNQLDAECINAVCNISTRKGKVGMVFLYSEVKGAALTSVQGRVQIQAHIRRLQMLVDAAERQSDP